MSMLILMLLFFLIFSRKIFEKRISLSSICIFFDKLWLSKPGVKISIANLLYCVVTLPKKIKIYIR